MEFLESNPNVRTEAEKLLYKFENRIAQLKKTDVETFRRKIHEAPDLKSKSQQLRNLLEQNVPASITLLEWLLQKCKNDKLLYLEWMSHRQHAALSLESFSRARTIAEEAHSVAKQLFQDLDENSTDSSLPRKPTYKAYVKACVNLLLVCRYQGKIKDAEAYLEEAKTVAAAENDVDDQHLLLILAGDILLAKGQLNKAIDTVFTPLLGESKISIENKGLLLQKLGNACRSAAQWGLAKDYLRQSIRIAQELGDQIAEFDRVTDLGNVYRSEGRIADALEQQVPHMAFAFKRGDLWGITVACFNMGFAYYSVTPNPDLNRALVLLSLKHDLAVRTENEPLRGMALNNLGKTFCALGQHEAALKVMKQSLEVARDTLNIAGEGMAYGNIGTAYRSLGKYDDAIENHMKYLQNAKGRGDDGGLAIMQRELSIDYVCKGDFQNAEKQARDAILTLETIRNKLGGEDASKIANFDKNQSETYSLLQVILCRQGEYAEALALSELARSRALTDLIRDKVIRSSSADEKLWIYSSGFVSKWHDFSEDILSDYLQAANELKTNFLVYSVVKDYELNGSPREFLYMWVVLNDTSAHGQQKIHFEKLALNERIHDDFLVEKGFFASLTRSFRQLSVEAEEDDNIPKPIPEEETVQVHIPKDPDVEEFLGMLKGMFLSEAVSNLAKERKEEKQLSENTSRTAAKDETLSSSRLVEDTTETVLERLIDCGSWENEGFKQLLQLYKVCIAPINNYLPTTDNGVVPSLTIIPHEFLFSVPFCCLHDGNNEYFVERFVLGYAPSLRALLLLNQRLNQLKFKQQNRKLKVLAVGNPTMVLPGIRDLPNSENEAKNVRTVFGHELCQLALRSDASKKFLMKELQNVDILHLATHACPQDIEAEEELSQGDYSMRGCFLLASSDEDCEGVVKATDVAAVNCSCQLVTLSCCETGLGKVTGDGVIGLYRGFFAAGAASVLVTLWKIRDDVTPVFMEHFYNEFKATENVPRSLRSAMLHCIRDRKLPPQQWAAFSYIGAISRTDNYL